jgi:hypothetical protein
MRRLLFIAVAWVGLGLLGCGPIIVEEVEGDPKPLLSSGTDPVEIKGISVAGDVLELELSYGGGCEEHTFWLEWDGAFLESHPVQSRLVLRHEARGDGCMALISGTRRFELTPVKEAWRQGYQRTEGTISLHVEGAPGSVLYTF